MFCLTLLCGVFLAGWLLPHQPGAVLPRSGRRSWLRCGKPCAFHCCYHPLCPRYSDGRRRLATRTRHFSRFPFARYRPFRCCPYSVCDTLTGRQVVDSMLPNQTSWRQRSRQSARRRGRGARGGSSVDTDTAAPVSYGTFLEALTECRFRRRPAASAHEQAFRPSSSCSPGTRLASTRTTQLALMPSTICCLRLLHATDECTLEMQPSERPVYPHAWEPRSTCSSSRAWHHHACCACPLVASCCSERPIPAMPAVGPLSSESIVPTLRWLRRCLTPAQIVPVSRCLWSPTRLS